MPLWPPEGKLCPGNLTLCNQGAPFLQESCRGQCKVMPSREVCGAHGIGQT